jgi:uncharacterized membrane protein (DUF4010 family)
VDAERFVSLAVSLGVGFLIGLQREQSAANQRVSDRSLLGGVRTYPLVALVGALGVLLSARFGAWIVVAGFVSFMVPLGLAYADDLRHERDRGLTSEVALVLTFLLGCLATAEGVAGSLKERLLLCASLAVAVTALLSYKDPLHKLAARVSRDDLYSTVKFGILALVVLPLLPDKGYGPYQALNPAKIGLVVVLIAGMSFCGYVAVRLLGPGKGLGVTGLLGGLVSSTAVTLSFSGRAKREPQASKACALGVILASTIMGLRVIVLVTILNRGLTIPVALPLGALTLAGAAAAAVLYVSSRKDGLGAENVQFSNPFEIGSALKFGLLFTVVLVVSKAATQAWGVPGSYLAALIAGTTDVDAVTVSLSHLAPAELPLQKASLAIFIAAATNTIVKAGIAVGLGGWSYGWRVLAAFLGMIAAGSAAAVVQILRS